MSGGIPAGEVRTYPRFTPLQRVQHLVLIVSFTLLALTGLPQKYASTEAGELLIRLLGGIEAVRVVHRLAAIALMAATIVHLVDAAYLVYVERTPLSMLPGVSDLRHAWQAVRYNLGLARERPRMGRYTFEEKVEYWSLVWGTALMIVTGFMLWNPIATARFLPGQTIPAAQVVHGGEAVLAVLAILIWHGYGVHLRHFNRSMFSGTMTEEEMRHEHPLELEDIQAGRLPPSPDPEARRERLRRFAPVAATTLLALLVGLWVFVTFEQTAIPTVPRQAPSSPRAQTEVRPAQHPRIIAPLKQRDRFRETGYSSESVADGSEDPRPGAPGMRPPAVQCYSPFNPTNAPPLRSHSARMSIANRTVVFSGYWPWEKRVGKPMPWMRTRRAPVEASRTFIRSTARRTFSMEPPVNSSPRT